jgi:uncharacterized protein
MAMLPAPAPHVSGSENATHCLKRISQDRIFRNRKLCSRSEHSSLITLFRAFLMGVAISFHGELLLALAMFISAALYSSVGHAGASAYIAAMALFGVDALTMRPTALVLNILVAIFASFRYFRAGFFDGRTLWPVLVGAVPMAFIGGAIQLPGAYYRPLVGVVLLIAALRLLWPRAPGQLRIPTTMPVWIGIPAGIAIGFLAGLTGTGGGIFLSPLLLFTGWANARTTSGIAAVFILCNSTAGLLGNFTSVRALPPDLPLYAGAVLAGAFLGTRFGIRRFANATILKALGIVLVIAGIKMIGVG